MPIQQITRGDSFSEPATLRADDTLFPIPLTATVELLIIGCPPDNDILLGPLSIASGDAGNDWTNGVVIPRMSAIDTALVSAGRQLLRVRVTDGIEVQSFDESVDFTN